MLKKKTSEGAVTDKFDHSGTAPDGVLKSKVNTYDKNIACTSSRMCGACCNLAEIPPKMWLVCVWSL